MKKLLIILIFVLALFLRVYKLGQYPVGFLWDEAGLGYNAYSILKTGRDEYGKILPLIFKSFGDYKPGFYVYLTVPFVAIFGLNEFSVRFPSALLGTMTVVLMYFLVKENQKFSRINELIYTDKLPIICSVLLAISPWHISFSRGAWEVNVMLFEFLLGFYFLTKYFSSQKTRFLYLSGVSLLATLFTYQSAKFLLPVLVGGYLFFERKELVVLKKRILPFLIILLSVYSAFALLTVIGGKGGRVKTMSIFSYPRSGDETNMILQQDKGNSFDFAIFHSAPVFFTRSVLGRYFNHFSGKFLFFSGDWSNPRNGIIYQGVMYYLDAIFLAVGLAVFFSRLRQPLENLMLFWLIVAPFSSALTRDSISSVRAFPMVIPLIFICSVGLNALINFLREERTIFRFSFYFVVVVLYLFLVVRFLDLYFIHDPKFTSLDRLYGYNEMINYIRPILANKNKVVVTNKYGQPYIFYLFYTDYDPRKYQKVACLQENPFGDVGEIGKLGNIEFRKIYWPGDKGSTNSLFIGDEFDLPMQDIVGKEDINFLKEIKFLNGKTAFRIVETK